MVDFATFTCVVVYNGDDVANVIKFKAELSVMHFVVASAVIKSQEEEGQAVIWT